MKKTSAPSAHPKLARIVLARPRLFACILLGIATALALPSSVASHLITRGVIGWNAGALLYLVMTLNMMIWSSHQRMR